MAAAAGSGEPTSGAGGNTGAISDVIVHPIVLLSVVDHVHRINNPRKRVVGILLGEIHDKHVDITNCYAVPFDEDERNPSIWFLDHNYHEEMRDMLRRVSANEKVVGWYSSGPRMKPSDLDIHRLIMKYCAQPVYVIVDVRPQADEARSAGVPTEAYTAIESVQNEGEEPQLSFQHIPSQIGAMEVEEIGVEHLLRDVKDTNISALTTQVHQMVSSLAGLLGKLRSIHAYLQQVVEGRAPVNYRILYHLQDMLNYLPNLQSPELTSALSTKTNDMMLVVYMSSMIRAIIALHNLINNKLELKAKEAEAEKKAAEKDEKKEGDKAAPDGDKKKKKEEGGSGSAP